MDWVRIVDHVHITTRKRSGLAHPTLSEEDVPTAKLSKSPANCSILELKRWLECGGAKLLGKKAELVEQVECYLSIENQINSKVDGGRWYLAKVAKEARAVESNASSGYYGKEAI